MVDRTLVAEIAPRIASIRQRIHAQPELGFRELATSRLVAAHLADLGFATHSGVGGTGVVGVVEHGTSSRAIALRADMDALPINEEGERAYKSSVPGVMHACGHDGHTAILLGVASYLAETRRFDGKIVLIFQPAEEGLGGAKAMLDDGLLERFPFEMLFGLHSWPGLAVGKVGIRGGAVMASSDRFVIKIRGRGAHAAIPHQSTDPVLVAAHMTTALQSIVSRRVDPVEAAVLSVTQFHAGEAFNAIPTTAELGGTVRALRPELRERLFEEIGTIARGIAQAFGAEVQVVRMDGYPPTINDEAAAGICHRTAIEGLGQGSVVTDMPPAMVAEDFSHYLAQRPGCFVWLGNGEASGANRLHNAHYDFDDRAIPTGMTLLAGLAERLLAAPGEGRCDDVHHG